MRSINSIVIVENSPVSAGLSSLKFVREMPEITLKNSKHDSDIIFVFYMKGVYIDRK